MGYSTQFSGKLTFTNQLTGAQLYKLSQYLGQDCREHPEWGAPHLTYIDLKITNEVDGLEWDGSEKTYNLPEIVNLLTTEMRKQFPDFALDGYLLAQGEEIEDRWMLKMQNGEAVSVKISDNGPTIQCPHCERTFILTKQ